MKSASLSIRSDLCKACFLCIEVCRKECLNKGTILNQAGYISVEFDPISGCNGCALCAIRCPEVAIEIESDE